jgi:hypothetical protein
MLVTAYEGLKSQQAAIPPHARDERMLQVIDRLIVWATVAGEEKELQRWQNEREAFSKKQ